MSSNILEASVKDVLKRCTIEGMVVKLPKEQLDRKLYQDVAKSLQGIGGKWKGGKVFGFVFEQDPTDLLEDLKGGTKRNIKKEFQFYGTPNLRCDKMVQFAELKPNHSILEPSGGRGAICQAINRVVKSPIIFSYELMDLNRTYLEKVPNVTVLGKDFLEHDESVKYDRIIMNPPFNKNQDITHLQKAYKCLLPKGIMVCIASIGWMYGSTKVSKAFREWLDDNNDLEETGFSKSRDEKWQLWSNIGKDAQFHRKNGDRVYIEMINSNEFKESGANVRSVLIVIEKKQ